MFSYKRILKVIEDSAEKKMRNNFSFTLGSTRNVCIAYLSCDGRSRAAGGLYKYIINSLHEKYMRLKRVSRRCLFYPHQLMRAQSTAVVVVRDRQVLAVWLTLNMILSIKIYYYFWLILDECILCSYAAYTHK